MKKSVVAATIAAVLAPACGGSGVSTPSPSPGPATSAPAAPAVVTLSAAGATPRELTVAAGERVTFVNNDSQPHDIAGGPDPTTPDCHEIDAVGFLLPGQSRQTAPLLVARTCDYHDHSNHAAVFTGRLVIR